MAAKMQYIPNTFTSYDPKCKVAGNFFVEFIYTTTQMHTNRTYTQNRVHKNCNIFCHGSILMVSLYKNLMNSHIARAHTSTPLSPIGTTPFGHLMSYYYAPHGISIVVTNADNLATVLAGRVHRIFVGYQIW